MEIFILTNPLICRRTRNAYCLENLECFFQNADISEWVILLLNVMGKCLFPIKEETPHAK